MENVYNTERDPFLIRESVGVEGCSAQNISTNSILNRRTTHLNVSLKTMDLLYLLNRVPEN